MEQVPPGAATTIVVLTSPELTKVGWGTWSIAANKTIVYSYHVNYLNDEVYELDWGTEGDHFATTLLQASPEYGLDFNDNFICVKNATAYDPGVPSMKPIEECYQFVGLDVVFLRDR